MVAVTTNPQRCSLQEAKAAGAEIFSVGSCTEVAVVSLVQDSLSLAHVPIPVILVSFVAARVNGR